MNGETFRSLALEIEGAFEGSHMRHADFRILNAKEAKSAKRLGAGKSKGGKIFASLSEDEDFGVVNLSADVQDELVAAFPGQFEVMNGAWGRAGWTKVVFKSARVAVVREALSAAMAKVAGIVTETAETNENDSALKSTSGKKRKRRSSTARGKRR